MEAAGLWMLLAAAIVLLGSGLPAYAVLMGVSVVFGLAGVALGGLEFGLLTALPSRIIGLLENDLLQALPLYVLMGALLNRLPLAERLFRCGVRLGGRSSAAPSLATLGLGALLAALGMVVPPMFAALLVLLMFDQVSHYPLTRIALAGVAAGAVGLTFNMGLRALRRSARSIVPALFALATFSAIFIFEMPLYIVVLTLGPLSIAWAYWRMHTKGKV